MDASNNAATTNGNAVSNDGGHATAASSTSTPAQDNNGTNGRGPAKRARKASAAKTTGARKPRAASGPRAKKRAADTDVEKTPQGYISTDITAFLEKLRIKNDEITAKQNELRDLEMTALYLRNMVDTMRAATTVTTPSNAAEAVGEQGIGMQAHPGTNTTTNVETENGQQGTSVTGGVNASPILPPQESGPEAADTNSDPTTDEAAE